MGRQDCTVTKAAASQPAPPAGAARKRRPAMANAPRGRLGLRSVNIAASQLVEPVKCGKEGAAPMANAPRGRPGLRSSGVFKPRSCKLLALLLGIEPRFDGATVQRVSSRVWHK